MFLGTCAEGNHPGYTEHEQGDHQDIARGRFDYASLNSSDSPVAGGVMPRGASEPGEGMNYQMLSPAELGQVERFAILLMSESHGADVREVPPPAE